MDAGDAQTIPKCNKMAQAKLTYSNFAHSQTWFAEVYSDHLYNSIHEPDESVPYQ